jgi:Tfp pilus assembly protein FimT
MKNRGFTFIEILIIIGIITTIAAFSVPMTVDFYNTQIMKSTSDEIFSALKKAQAYSLYRRNDESFGVAFEDSEDDNFYVLFDGNYIKSLLDDDDVYNLQGITVDFADLLGAPVETEVISFEKGTGLPSDFVVITLTKGVISQDISICESGLIEIGSDCENIE